MTIARDAILPRSSFLFHSTIFPRANDLPQNWIVIA
jgi:hypothetical protein